MVIPCPLATHTLDTYPLNGNYQYIIYVARLHRCFCVIPYFACKAIALPDLLDFLNIDTSRLCEMEDASSLGDDDDLSEHISPDFDSLSATPSSPSESGDED
jgi:hypothetical protein